MQIIEQAEIVDLQGDFKTRTTDIVKYCHACQLQHQKSQRFSFSVQEPLIGELKHTLQIEAVKLVHEHVLHVFYIETGFQNGSFNEKIDADNI